MESSQSGQTKLSIEYRHCHSHQEFRTCMTIERAVWNDPGLSVPFAQYVVAAETGGQVLGAFDGERMVGFTFAMIGWRNGRPYLHSHMTGVLPEAQNRGVGRGLKLFQREKAIEQGIDLVEWTFDPLALKNAYFNLMRLGAVARRFLPNAYGVTASPLHGGLPTDRLMAEWELQSERAKRCLEGKRPVASFSARAERIAAPRAIDEIKLRDPAGAKRAQDRLREEFLHWFGRNYTAVAVDEAGDQAHYILEPEAA